MSNYKPGDAVSYLMGGQRREGTIKTVVLTPGGTFYDVVGPGGTYRLPEAEFTTVGVRAVPEQFLDTPVPSALKDQWDTYAAEWWRDGVQAGRRAIFTMPGEALTRTDKRTGHPLYDYRVITLITKRYPLCATCGYPPGDDHDQHAGHDYTPHPEGAQ